MTRVRSHDLVPRCLDARSAGVLDPPNAVPHARWVSRRLDELDLKRSGVVARVNGEDAVAVRLLEMGFVPGTHVKLVKRAPTGDPLQLQLRGYHLSLRRAEAARVELKES